MKTTNSTKPARTNKTTSKQVLAFMAERCTALRGQAPGYVNLTVQACAHESTGVIRPTFAAYNQHCGHSPQFEDADHAISWVAAQVKGRRQSDMVRAKAAELLLEAQKLEAAGD